LIHQTTTKTNKMDNNQKINDLQAQIEKLQAEQAFLKAEQYLASLSETATYTNSLMAPYDGKPAERSLRISLYSTMEMLPEIKRAAKHYKNVDDSQDWPTWKAEAYKQAKIYDTYRKATGWL